MDSRFTILVYMHNYSICILVIILFIFSTNIAKSYDKDTSGDLNIEISLMVEPSNTPNQSFSSHLSTASESSLTTLSTSTPKSSLFPSSFSIPSRWRPSILNAIHARTVTKDIRNEIARDLVTHIYGSLGKPTATFCCFVAQQLILKYPFMSVITKELAT